MNEELLLCCAHKRREMQQEMSRISVEIVQISHWRGSDLEMASRNVDSKINSLFNIRVKSEELHNKSILFAFTAMRRFVLFILVQQK